jgi:hypothetical protein
MKKTLLSAAAVLLALAAAAQDIEVKSSGSSVQVGPADGRPGTTSIRVAGWEVLLDDTDDKAAGRGQRGPNWHRKHRFPGYYDGRIGFLEAGQPFFRTRDNSYAAYPDSEKEFMTLNVWKTDYVAFNLSTISTSLVRGGWLGATLGIGVAYNGYSLDQPTALAKIDRMLRPVGTEHSLDKCKIRSWWFHVPLVLEFNPTSNFFVSAGGYTDLMFWSGAKWKSPKQKLSDPYINPLQVGLTARIGFRDFYFFGKYSLSEFFQTGKGPRLNQYTFGIGLNM